MGRGGIVEFSLDSGLNIMNPRLPITAGSLRHDMHRHTQNKSRPQTYPKLQGL